MRTRFTATRRAVAALGAGVGALVVAVYAYAGHEPAAVASYTGCLNTSSGTLTNFAAGEAPLAPCKDKDVPVHLGGGDITAVTAGPGLSGGGENGAVSLGVDESTIVTGVTPGFGLTGGGSGGNVSLAVDPSVFQRRVATDCSPGGSISKINEDGSASCKSIGGVVATLNAGTVAAEGSHDTSLCEFNSSGGGAGPFDATSATVSLGSGTYMVVPGGPADDSFRFLIRKTEDLSDPDTAYEGRVFARIVDVNASATQSKFIRELNNTGDTNNLAQDFGTFEGPGDFYLEITASADACTFASIGGPVDIVKVG